MYDPAGRPSPYLALLWPALAAAAARDLAAFTAQRFAELAVGAEREPPSPPAWTTPHAIALELKSVRLRDFSTAAATPPVLLCAPFALHGASITDLAPGHSLVGALRAAGLQRLLVADWRSATPDMRFLGIDDYLADLNVLIDEIGAPVDLVGLCQGGWLALIYAARFRAKVRKLVLAGAPIDTAAAPSALSTLAQTTPASVFRELVQLGNGVLPGRKMLTFWGPQSLAAEDVWQVLQSTAPIGSAAFADLNAIFRTWYDWTLDLPGAFFLETVERLYKRNELAAGAFVALGRTLSLGDLTVPMFLLAARDDELVAPAQLFATERHVGTPSSELRKAIAPCRHLGLFAGKHVLEQTWPRIAGWLGEVPEVEKRDVPGRKAERVRSVPQV
jgi:poly(3-hydroxybutyrate) depolymerase